MKGLQPWYARFGKKIVPNAFYMNLLLVPMGGHVGRHVDATLRSHVAVADIVPIKVSVLWLQVPPQMQGGELNLFKGRRNVASIVPQEGMLAHFRGELGHEVAKVRVIREGQEMRASLVCEQYVLPEDVLDELSPFFIKSNAGFQTFLQEATQRIEKD